MSSAPERKAWAKRFVATSPAMVAVLERIDAYARADTPAMLVGATGTGKTTVAEGIHELSGRRGLLIAQSAGEFDAPLERSQLFGHERGAFTGAVDRHLGLLEQAADGTLLLDDFHHTSGSTQMALLRVLDRGAFRRVGGSRDLAVRCRVLIGLTDDANQLAAQGRLLPELRFRLGYSTIHLPPLAARRDDIPLLALRFLARCPEETGAPGPARLAPEAMAALQAAQWPGNLRQLGMIIRDAYLRALGRDVIRLRHLSELLALPLGFQRHGPPERNAAAIRAALAITRGRVGDAARLLHTARSTIYGYLSSPDITAGGERRGGSAPVVPQGANASRTPGRWRKDQRAAELVADPRALERLPLVSEVQTPARMREIAGA